MLSLNAIIILENARRQKMNYTKEEPTQCKKCGSKKIYLDVHAYVKDKNKKDTNEPQLGMWMCEECGEILGRKMSKEYNEIY